MVIFTLVVLIWEFLCVALMSLSSTGNVCLREDLIGAFGANFWLQSALTEFV